MTAEQRSVKLAISYFEDFDISSEEQKYHALKVRVLSAITEAVAEDRELLAKEADARAKRYPSNETDRWGNGYGYAMSEFAAAIRKVKP